MPDTLLFYSLAPDTVLFTSIQHIAVSFITPEALLFCSLAPDTLLFYSQAPDTLLFYLLAPNTLLFYSLAPDTLLFYPLAPNTLLFYLLAPGTLLLCPPGLDRFPQLPTPFLPWSSVLGNLTSAGEEGLSLTGSGTSQALYKQEAAATALEGPLPWPQQTGTLRDLSISVKGLSLIHI